MLNGTVADNLIDSLRADLHAASFTTDALNGLWGNEAAAALFRGLRVPALRASRRKRALGSGTSALATLGRLFVLGVPVAVRELADALPTLGVLGAAMLELIQVRAIDGGGEAVHPLLDLRPYSFSDSRGDGSWWIASDLGELALGHAIPEGHVLGIGRASTTLSGLMIADPVDSVLDLGTGCGIQALHASRHARRVVATDTSERALELARFNARLNGIDSIEYRLGSLFEPVDAEQFDQIVSNPPFVITPRTPGVPAYEYRDGGMTGDALVAAVIRGAAQHLRPGGIAQLLGNWEYHVHEAAFERVGGWLNDCAADGSALDAWVIEREVLDCAEYAETWIRDGGTRAGTAEFDRLYSAWLDDFEAREVRAVGFGYLTLRRPKTGAPTLRRLEKVMTHGSNESGLGARLAATLRAHDWLAARDDSALGSATLSVAPDVTEERHYWPGADDPTVITLHQGGGFGRAMPAGTALAAFVGACDGELTVAAICAALAQLLEVGESALRAELLPQVRELIFTGFLLTDGSAGAA